MSLREEPVVVRAQLGDRRDVEVRVVVPDDSYVTRSDLDTVVVELVSDGETLGVITTPLDPTDLERARVLAKTIRDGLESGSIEATAEGIESAALSA
jgi:hypothetical protein